MSRAGCALMMQPSPCAQPAPRWGGVPPSGAYGGGFPGQPSGVVPSNGRQEATAPPPAVGGSTGGSAAVALAETQLGKLGQNIDLPGYTRRGQRTNDCADFVSSALQGAGMFHKTGADASVSRFKADLQKQGYQQVSKANAQPGDVAIIQGGGVSHTELVAARGATRNIGANGTSQEQVSDKDNLNWANGRITFWHKG